MPRPSARIFRFLALALLLALGTGCAGFRGGWQSVPYLGSPPPETEDPRPGATALDLPGLSLEIELGNRLQTRDTKVYLFALPLSVDLRDKVLGNPVPGRTRLFLRVTAEQAGAVFRPQEVVLELDGRRVTAVTGHEFGRWDAQGRADEDSGTWGHRPLDEAFVLAEAGRRYLLSVDFDLEPPSPRVPGLAVDLSKALQVPGQAPLPRIHFVARRWKQGYT